MKQIAWIVFLIIFLGIGFVLYHNRPVTYPKNNTSHLLITPTITPSPIISTKAIFVPYWTLSGTQSISSYDTCIYFGIVSTLHGIDTTEDGFLFLDKFNVLVSCKKKLLTIRMIDQSVNAEVLKNPALQHQIISESLQIAKEKKFDGVVLDFEYSALSFDAVVKSVSEFSNTFADATHHDKLLFYQTIYGDVFYRARPFDVATIAKKSDGIFVMAYDLHKASSDAGPNFPLRSDDYSLEKMTQDFLAKVPAQKMTVVFGMFGYDWKINNKGLSLGVATSLSLSEIRQKFLQKCSFTDCQITRDNHSTETKISYLDAQGLQHVVWFEDITSVTLKEAFLTKKGIGSTAFWAYTYF